MEKMIYSMIQVLIFVIATVLVSTNPTKKHETSPTTSQPPKAVQNEVVKTWPKIFYLSMDPNDPIICYLGIKVNFTDNENKTTPLNENNKQQIFTLSDDPLYTCKRLSEPINLADNHTILEDDNGGNATNNVTCIRRDYEKNISAIFIHHAGPLHRALIVLNGNVTVTKWDKVDENIVLKEYEVNCLDYGIDSGDKVVCPGAAASLCG